MTVVDTVPLLMKNSSGFFGRLGNPVTRAGLAIAIGADFDLRLALAQESVLDCKANLGVKNGFACAVFHNEIRTAGAEACVNNGNFRRVAS